MPSRRGIRLSRVWVVVIPCLGDVRQLDQNYGMHARKAHRGARAFGPAGSFGI